MASGNIPNIIASISFSEMAPVAAHMRVGILWSEVADLV